MRHASLFSGIGGFDLAAQWMGWDNVFQVEKDEFCQKVLTKNFPHVKRYGDIREFDGTPYRGTIDILTGGFPCQPYSLAGKRKGKDDDRHLWPEMLRVIGEIQPAYVVGENVYGLVNWNGGMVFDEVQSDLENKGYEVQPIILPACALNAPHRRDRLWFIAHRNGESRNLAESGQRYETRYASGTCAEEFASNPNTQGLSGEPCREQQIISRSEGKSSRSQFSGTHPAGNEWEVFPTQSPVCGRNDGIPNRVDRIKSLGNAIVPQVAFEIFKAIEMTQI